MTDNVLTVPFVLYHANCNDGFCAAWVYNSYVERFCEYRPVQYNEPLPDVALFRGRKVIILDFSYPADDLHVINKVASSLVVLDHHETARQTLEGLDFCHFDMNKSGARMTWDHFCVEGLGMSQELRPWLVDYTEDRVLWRWKLPESEQVSAALKLCSYTFEAWDTIAASTPSDLADEGRTLLRSQDIQVEAATARSRIGWMRLEINIGTFWVPCVNTTTLVSEITGRLAEDHPFAVSFLVLPNGQYQYSLRSRKSGIDVSAVAKEYGGGGHPRAAGFQLDHLLPLSTWRHPNEHQSTLQV